MERMPRTAPIYDLSRVADRRQQLTAGSADFAVCWTVGLLAAVAARPLFGATSHGPVLVLVGVGLAAWALNAIVLAGLTGQSVGAVVAQTADVCARSGRPVGVLAMARQILVDGAAARDPEFGEIRRVSLTGR